MKEITQAVPQHLLAEPAELARGAKNVLGKDDFLKLLMTQLQHQDPLKPMDHQEFGAQLAQFSQLEQLSNIGTDIKGLRSDRVEDTRVQAIGMIGKRVKALGNEVELTHGQAVNLTPQLKEGVKPTKASIYDGGGSLVRELDLNGKTVTEGILWDGKNTEGTSLPSGKYTFRVLGVDQRGQGLEMGAEVAGKVTGIELQGKIPMLVVSTQAGTVKIDMGKVSQVSLDGESEVAKPQVALPAAAAPKVALAIPSQDADAEEVERPTLAAPETEETIDSRSQRWESFLPQVEPMR